MDEVDLIEHTSIWAVELYTAFAQFMHSSIHISST